MAKKETELKPCPFCGKKPKLVEGGLGYKIRCCFGDTHYCLKKDNVIEFWNTRKGEKK